MLDLEDPTKILYRTMHEVIGTPYHRNSPGILDTYGTMTAETDEQAFEIMCKQMSEIDLLITDLYMPKMNGDELCKKVRQAYRQCFNLQLVL